MGNKKNISPNSFKRHFGEQFFYGEAGSGAINIPEAQASDSTKKFPPQPISHSQGTLEPRPSSPPCIQVESLPPQNGSMPPPVRTLQDTRANSPLRTGSPTPEMNPLSGGL